MDKRLTIKRVVKCSKQVNKYKQLLIKLNELELELLKYKIPIRSISVIKKFIQQRHNTLTNYIGNRIKFLVGFTNKYFTEDKIFGVGAIETIEGVQVINQDLTYDTINYISSQELQDGYILFNMLLDNPDNIIIEEIEMMLNLHTGEFTRAPSSGKIPKKPVL